MEFLFNIIDLATGWKIDLIIRKSRPFSLEEFDRRVRLESQGIQLFIIAVYSDQGFLSCWTRQFKVGDRYLVYAFERKLLVTTNCGRTMPPENAADDLTNLNSFWWRLGARVLPRWN